MTAASEVVCPSCGAATWPPAPGGRLCLTCTELELGESYEQIRDRATARIQGVAKKKWRVTS